jgi:hypothetical protein
MHEFLIFLFLIPVREDKLLSICVNKTNYSNWFIFLSFYEYFLCMYVYVYVQINYKKITENSRSWDSQNSTEWK